VAKTKDVMFGLCTPVNISTLKDVNGTVDVNPANANVGLSNV
jgi:hypothetical protein